MILILAISFAVAFALFMAWLTYHPLNELDEAVCLAWRDGRLSDEEADAVLQQAFRRC